ncbi:MAG: 50S ribosomal protein L6 [Candidatus Saganbacteria bacterium]|nr:50S ribosomal protein L6 [Candidatus Saganbacteria bacterium]
MSRIGRKLIEVPKDIKVELPEGRIIVSGPLGKLERDISPKVSVEFNEGKIKVAPNESGKVGKAFHGLYRALIANMIIGVKDGFEKNLEFQGVGYKGVLEGKKLVMQLGFSHPVEIDPPEGIKFTVEGATKVKVFGIDKELVSKIAAEVRKSRPPEPYKGKGVKYRGEMIRRKAGKAAKAVARPA